MSNVLVLAPHADDETFGMGGTIAKRALAGDAVHVVLCSIADTAFYHLGRKVITRKERKQEFLNACESLGCRPIVLDHAGHSGKDLEQIPIRQLIHNLEEVQDTVGASVWYIVGPSHHQDHRRVFEAGMAAARIARANAPVEIYAYELPTYAAEPRQWQMHLSLYEDVTNSVDRLKRAISAYESQAGSVYCQQKLEMSRWRGYECKCEYAEAFEVVRIYR